MVYSERIIAVVNLHGFDTLIVVVCSQRIATGSYKKKFVLAYSGFKSFCTQCCIDISINVYL